MNVRADQHNKTLLPRSPLSSLVVKRLSLYLRYFEELDEKGVKTSSSHQLAEALGLSAAQVRKDLGYLGQFGRPGVGYYVPDMVNRLRKVFGTDKVWDLAVVGVGSLGRALLRYKGFLKRGFRPVAAFDIAKSKIGKRFGGITVQPMSQLESTIRDKRIKLAILSVPASVAREVAERLLNAGIKGILNFAPVNLNLSERTAVVPVDLAVQLEQISYMVNASCESYSGTVNQRRQDRMESRSKKRR